MRDPAAPSSVGGVTYSIERQRMATAVLLLHPVTENTVSVRVHIFVYNTLLKNVNSLFN